MNILAIANQKGGVGKTTTAINLAVALARKNRQVLLIDADPQANATTGLGIHPGNLSHHLYHCFIGSCAVSEAIHTHSEEGIDILPAHTDLVGVEVEFVDRYDRELLMKRVIEQLPRRYDYVVIDCAPSLGILTVNALVSATHVLIPVQCEYFALEGLGKLLSTIRIVRRRLNPLLSILGLLPTMFDSRLILAREVLQELRRHFGERVFEAVIHRNTRLAEAPSHGKSIFRYDSSSRGARDYRQLAEEVIRRLEGKKIPHDHVGKTPTRTGQRRNGTVA